MIRRFSTLMLMVAIVVASGPAPRAQDAREQGSDIAAARAGVPAAPAAFTATAGNGRADLSWQAVAGADGYFIYRAANGTWDRFPIATVTATTFTSSGLVNGVSYTFAVAAYNAAGTSPFSTLVTAAPVAPGRAASVLPQPITNTAESENAAASQVDLPAPVANDDRTFAAPASATLRDPVASSGPAATSTPAAPSATMSGSFAVQGMPRTSAPASPQPSATAAPQPSPTASPSTSELQPVAPAAVQAGTTTQRQAASSASAQSKPVVTTDSTPSAPTARGATLEQPSPDTEVSPAAVPGAAPAGLTVSTHDGRIVLRWQAVSGASGYLVFRAEGGTWGATPLAVTSSTSYTNTGLTNGATYTYKVAACNRDGTGPQSGEISAMPLAPPAGVKTRPGDSQATISWQASTGATAYAVYRSASTTLSTFVPVAANLTTLNFTDTGLANGTTYYYRVGAAAPLGTSELSSAASVVPIQAAPAAPSGVTATPGNARIVLAWDPVPGATSYRVYRSTTGEFTRTPIATVTATSLTNTGLVNGTTYFYVVVARNTGGDSPFSPIVSAAPMAPPAPPAAVNATPGNARISLKWAASPGAAYYNLYRGTTPGGQGTTPYVSGLSTTEFVDNVPNGPLYYYRVTAVNLGGESARSTETNAAAEGVPLIVDDATKTAYRLLRQAAWGPRPGDVERVKQIGAAAFIDEQLAMGPSEYPDALLTQSLDVAQEHFMQLALTGPDQLRQRVAWALHKIWVVSAIEVPSTTAIVTYYRLMMNGALGNYRDLMEAVTLNPTMGRYLNMLNNRSQHATGVPPNENYARELMQLFTLGVALLNPDGTPVLDASGTPVPAYTEEDVSELARILTGWTFGDGNPATTPSNLARENYAVPMEAVPAFHDPTPKVFLGYTFPAHQSAMQDLEQALDILFNHPNVGPFVSRQLIQQLVTSNPSPQYVADVAAVFNNPAARGDLRAVVRAILLHPEASAATTTSGKLSEPVLFVVSTLRALGATVADYPFMSVYAEAMGQKVFYPPSVFSYFSPGFRVRGTNTGSSPPLAGPEFQTLTSVTALERANYVGNLLAGRYGSAVTVDLTQFDARAADPEALVDYCNLVLAGGRMAPEERSVIVRAVRNSATTGTVERVRTAIYLSLVIASSQVDR